MSGSRESPGGDREDRRALLPPGRGGGGGGDDEEDRRGRMPGCLGFFSGWKKRPGTTTRRVAAVPPPPPWAQDVKEPAQVKEIVDVKDVPVAEIQAPPELPPEIDSLIASMLHSIFDRSSLQNVCGRWQNATLNCAKDPLPLIVNADYTLANCFAEGFDCVPKNMHPSVEHPDDQPSTCLGSFDSWIVVAYEHAFHPQENLHPIHNRCQFIQPVKGTTLSLPNPSSFECMGVRSRSLQIVHGDGAFNYCRPVREGSLRLQKAVVSRSSGHMNFKVAALAMQRGHNHIIFCTPESSSWMVSSSDFVTIDSDLEFFEKKLFFLGTHQEELFVIEFGPHMCVFPTVSLVCRCGAVNPPVLDNTEQHRNLVRSTHGLLLVVRYFTITWDQLTAVRVLELDTKSFTWSEKRTLGPMSILISLNSSKCIDASGHDEIRSDHVYFLDQFCPQFLPAAEDAPHFSYRSQVYSLKTGLVTEQLIGREPTNRRPGYPMWFFPTD